MRASSHIKVTQSCTLLPTNACLQKTGKLQQVTGQHNCFTIAHSLQAVTVVHHIIARDLLVMASYTTPLQPMPATMMAAKASATALALTGSQREVVMA